MYKEKRKNRLDKKNLEVLTQEQYVHMIPELSPRFHYVALGGYCTHYTKQAAEPASFYE